MSQHEAFAPYEILLSLEQKQRIEQLARRRGASIKETLMALVEQALRLEISPEPLPGSFLEAIQDLAGSVDDDRSPTDLASNPIHMQNFGR